MSKDGKDTKIKYSDFITKVMSINQEIDDFNIEKAFNQIDSQGTGKITKESLALFLKRKGDDRATTNANLMFQSAKRKLKASDAYKNKEEFDTQPESLGNEMTLSKSTNFFWYFSE